MSNINPKVVALIALLLIIGALVYWFAEERFEASPPVPDQTQTATQG